MNPLQLPLHEFQSFIFVLIRITAMFMALPAFGSKTVPPLVKIGLSMLLTILIFPTLQVEPLPLFHKTIPLVLAVLWEIGIGLLIGYLVQLIFAGIQVAGQMTGYQMGFGVVNVLDPQSNSQLSIIALFQNLLAMLLFLALNVHHRVMGAIAESFRYIAPGAGHYPPALVEQVIGATGALFVVAIKIGAPMMAVLLFTNIGMGMIAKTVPQMNVFIVAFPLQIGVGLIMLGLSLPTTIRLLQGIFSSLEGDIGRLILLIAS
ncbi:MAG: flagellar biosynthetic protein FliR [bacterium]|nr:flagellar biosynthetic protein FliR [bacterium]